MPKRMPLVSTDDFIVSVRLLVASGGNANIMDDAVLFAFVDQSDTTQPASGQFNSGFWLTNGTKIWAAITIGPDALVVPVGKYIGWIWIQDNPTQPILPADTLEIYSGAG